jgi:leader peptidase (prepilin peptidase)/N-methyltransferase
MMRAPQGGKSPVTPASVQEFLEAMWLVEGAFVGACLGSFANVVVARVPRGESVVHPPSRCPHCLTPIRAWQNIPVVSWVMLRGRSRCCGRPISPRYVLVEALAGLLGYLVVLFHGASLLSVLYGLALLFLLCVALIDLDSYLIPAALSLGLIPLGLGFHAVMQWQQGADLLLGLKALSRHSVLGALMGYAPLWLIRVVATPILRRTGRLQADEEAMGRGDEELMAGIGAVLGPLGVWWTFLLGSTQGSLVGLWLRLREGARPDGPEGAARERGTLGGLPKPIGDADEDSWEPPEGSIQFGPFLALGAAQFILFQAWLPRMDLSPLLEASWW